ncbi:MAG: hypothetical protein NTW33_01055 [Methanoregula sp.]|nr:hypothetical protein [Methanoregula sp.]
MNKTFTLPQNIAQEAINVHEQKTSFAGIIRNIIVAEEADGKYEQKTSFPGIIGNRIVTQEAIGVHEQNTRFPGIMSIDSRDFMEPRNQCHAITRGRDLSYIRSEIPSAENKTGIMHSSKGATA